MGTIAARKAMKVVENTRNVLAIELLCATQAIDLRSELADGFAGLGEGTKFVHNLTRKKVLKVNKDRVLSDDIRVLGEFIKSGELVTGLEKAIGVLEM